MSCTCCEAATSGTGSQKLESSPRYARWCPFGTKVHLLLLHNDLAGEASVQLDDGAGGWMDQGAGPGVSIPTF
jgi:hypothetical protein